MWVECYHSAKYYQNCSVAPLPITELEISLIVMGHVYMTVRLIWTHVVIYKKILITIAPQSNVFLPTLEHTNASHCHSMYNIYWLLGRTESHKLASIFDDGKTGKRHANVEYVSINHWWLLYSISFSFHHHPPNGLPYAMRRESISFW